MQKLAILASLALVLALAAPAWAGGGCGGYTPITADASTSGQSIADASVLEQGSKKKGE